MQKHPNSNIKSMKITTKIRTINCISQNSVINSVGYIM